MWLWLVTGDREDIEHSESPRSSMPWLVGHVAIPNAACTAALRLRDDR